MFPFYDRVKGGKPLNPTFPWLDILVKEMNFPFVKRGLFTHGHATIAGLNDFVEELSSCTDGYSQGVRKSIEEFMKLE